MGGGDKQARQEADAGSAQDPNSPTDLGSTNVDDEMNSFLEVDGSEKRQAKQAAEANREQPELAGGDLLTQMRAMMEEVIRHEKAETWEKVCLIKKKKVDTHEVKIQEHDSKFQDLENAVAVLKNQPTTIKSEQA